MSLFFLYFIGFGISRLFMMVLARRTLFNRPRHRLSNDTCWREAAGYQLDMAGLEKQS